MTILNEIYMVHFSTGQVWSTWSIYFLRYLRLKWMISKFFGTPYIILSYTISDLVKKSENVSQTQKYAVYIAVHTGLAKSHLRVNQKATNIYHQVTFGHPCTLPRVRKIELLFFGLEKLSLLVVSSSRDLLSSMSVFACGLQRQQLKIKPPHFTVFHHIHHFALVKSQAILFKIHNVIGPSIVLGRPTGLLPFVLASKAYLGILSCGILLTWPNHLNMAKPSLVKSFNSEKKRLDVKIFSNLRATHLVKQCNSFDSS